MTADEEFGVGVADLADPPGNTESPSAALARVTAERDEMREARDAARESLRIVTEKRESAVKKTADVIEQLWATERDLAAARAELVSARTELEQLRATPPRVVTVTPLAPLPPLTQRDCWICTTCGTESDLPGTDEHGALTPVTVTTTIRTEEHP